MEVIEVLYSSQLAAIAVVETVWSVNWRCWGDDREFRAVMLN